MSSATPPVISCDPSEMAIDGETDSWAAVHVHGTASAAAGIARVTVDDLTVSLDSSGKFSAIVPASFGANAFHVVATDKLGAVGERYCPFIASAQFQPEDTPSADSVTLALGQNAVDDDVQRPSSGPIKSLADVIDAGTSAAELAEIVDAYLKTQPYTAGSGYYIGHGCELAILCVDVYYQPSIQKVKLSSESIDLQLQARGLRVLVGAQGLSLGIQSQGVVGLAASSGIATVAKANAHADYGVGASGGSLDATLTPGTFASTNEGVAVNVDNFLVDLAAQIFPDLIDKILDNVFQDLVSVVLDDILHAITVDTLGVGITLPKLDGSGDLAVNLTGSFSSADASSARLLAGVAPVFAVSGGTPHSLPSAGIAAQGDTIAPLDPPLGARSVGLGIHDEVANQLMHKLWRNGYFQTALSPPALTKLGVDVGKFEEGFTKYDMRIAAPLPPVVAVEAETKNLRVGLAGVRVLMTLPDETDPTPFEVEVFALLDATPALAQGKITIGDITTVSTNATVVSMPGTYDPTTSSGLTDLATQVVKLLLVDVLGQSLIAVPIPQIKLPQMIGPIKLPAPVTLGLLDPALSETSDYLVVGADLTQVP